MKKNSTLLPILTACALLSGCGDDPVSDSVTVSDSTATNQGTFTLTVTVVDEVTNNFVEGADVIIADVTKETNASGVATFTLSSGSYSVEIDEAVGYFNEYASITINADTNVTYQLEEFTESSAGSAKVVSIAASSNGEELSFQYPQDTWQSGSTIVNGSDSYYSDLYEVTSGTGWGGESNAAIAWGNEATNSVNIQDFTHLSFKVNPTAFVPRVSASASKSNPTAFAASVSSYTSLPSMTVSIQSATEDKVENLHSLSTGKKLEGGWIEMNIQLPKFRDMTWIGLFLAGEGTIKVADVHLFEEREGTPLPSETTVEESVSVVVDDPDVVVDDPDIVVDDPDVVVDDPDVVVDDPEPSTDSAQIAIAAPVPTQNVAFIYYSGEEDTFEMGFWGDTWGSGTAVSDADGALELSPGGAWGANHAAIAWGNDANDDVETNFIDISSYQFARFKVKASSDTKFDVSVQNTGGVEDKLSYDIASGTDLGDGWVEMEVPLPSYSEMTWFGLIFITDDPVQIADVYFAGEEVTPEVAGEGPLVAAPTNANYSDDEVFVLYSDVYTPDTSITNWSEDWWNAPTYTEQNIDSDNMASFKSVADGGVSGIVFEVSDVSSYHSVNFDMFVEEGINKVELKLVSASGTGGEAIYTIEEPKTGEWLNFSLTRASDFVKNGEAALNPAQIEKIGVQFWGELGKSLYLDNIFFFGQSLVFDTNVTVVDSNNVPIPGASVSVGDNVATADAQGVAMLSLSEGDHTILITAEGYGLVAQTESVNADLNLDISLSPLEPLPIAAAEDPTVTDEDAFVLYSNALTVDRVPSTFTESWWQAPSFSEATIDGNATIQYTIIPGGEGGGVSGISFGNPDIDGSYVDGSSFSTLHFDTYATAGISLIKLQIVSSSGAHLVEYTPTTEEWSELTIDLNSVGQNFNSSELQQIGVQLWGTTSDSLYIDNIYFD